MQRTEYAPSRWSLGVNSQLVSVPILSAFLPGAAVGPYLQGRGKPAQTIPPNASTQMTYQGAIPSYTPGGSVMADGISMRTILVLIGMVIVGYLLLHVFWRKR